MIIGLNLALLFFFVLIVFIIFNKSYNTGLNKKRMYVAVIELIMLAVVVAISISIPATFYSGLSLGIWIAIGIDALIFLIKYNT